MAGAFKNSSDSPSDNHLGFWFYLAVVALFLAEASREELKKGNEELIKEVRLALPLSECV